VLLAVGGAAASNGGVSLEVGGAAAGSGGVLLAVGGAAATNGGLLLAVGATAAGNGGVSLELGAAAASNGGVSLEVGMTIILLLLDRRTPTRPDLHFLCLWFKIPILRQALEETTCGSKTPKNFSVRLDPGELSSFQ
jgi:hypothetical protein